MFFFSFFFFPLYFFGYFLLMNIKDYGGETDTVLTAIEEDDGGHDGRGEQRRHGRALASADHCNSRAQQPWGCGSLG